jgi:hypothetical protein
MSNLIDLDNLTIANIEKLKKVLGAEGKLSEQDEYDRRWDEIGTRPGWMKITQVNIDDRKYFCTNDQQERELISKYPGDKTESFKIELPISTANRYLNDPENVKAFE